MRTHIVIATHGKFAEGILDSAKLILGSIDDIESLCCYEKKDLVYSMIIKDKIENFDFSNKRLIVITDLLGGSVNNEFMKYINEYKYILLSGLSLSLLIEVIMKRDDIDIEMVQSIINDTSKYTICCNTFIEQYKEDSFDL